MLIGTEEKHGVMSPTILGPFTDAAAATAWLTEDGEGYFGYRPEVNYWFTGEADAHGGYPAVHVISAEDCKDPDDWLAEERDLINFTADADEEAPARRIVVRGDGLVEVVDG